MDGAFTQKIYDPADLIICPADYDDAAAIARLITQLGYPTGREEIIVRLKELFARSDDHLTAVAKLRGQGIGVIAAAFGFHLEHTGAYGRINALSIEQDHRNQGIGALLLAYAETWLRKKGPIFASSTAIFAGATPTVFTSVTATVKPDIGSQNIFNKFRMPGYPLAFADIRQKKPNSDDSFTKR